MRFYALILLSFLCPILAFAETCVNDYGGNNSCVENRTIADAAGDCTKLGYTDNATSCADGESFLKCPFDESKGRCIKYKTEETSIDISTLKDWSTQKPDCNTNAGDKLLTYTQDGKTYYRCVLWNVTCANFFGGECFRYFRLVPKQHINM